MRLKAIILALLAIVLATASPSAIAQEGPGYDYYVSGDVTAETPGTPSFGLLLTGGSGWSADAWRWFIGKAGGGHIVLLRASQDGSDGEWIHDEIGSVASVQTFVFSNRNGSYDPRVIAALEAADGVFIAGGDQANYVRFWKDTPVSEALNSLVASGHPIGGTSAGLAILGGVGYGALAEQAVDSPSALANPNSELVTLVGNFLQVPLLERVITDTHFSERYRLGRLVAFLAQARSAGLGENMVGLGIDEDTTLAVEEDGSARLFTLSGGHAWLVDPEGEPTYADNGSLNWDAIRLTGIGPESSFNLATMEVTNPAFAGTAQVAGGIMANVPVAPGNGWKMVIHGGSGVIERGSLTPEAEAEYRAALAAALDAGARVLGGGGSSLDAVEATIRVLEDDPLFNAGRGAVFDAEGRNQLDASIMDGATLNAGAASGLSTTRHPITLARAVMERSRHVLLSGEGADRFALEQGIEQVDPSYFHTQRRWESFMQWQRNDQAYLDPTHLFGTVGAAAIDANGNLAAGTSTGGLTGKRWGRIGDSPIIGAGTYAANGRCAVSGTGTGEYFIRENAARQVCDRVAWKGETIQEALDGTIATIGALGGDGGLIALDGEGNFAFSMNTEGMYRGVVSHASAPEVAIYEDEDIGNNEQQ